MEPLVSGWQIGAVEARCSDCAGVELFAPYPRDKPEDDNAPVEDYHEVSIGRV